MATGTLRTKGVEMERPRNLNRGVNYHHLFWTARQYNYANPLEEAFRENIHLVQPMIRWVHAELHDDLGPPKKPTNFQMSYVLGRLAVYSPLTRMEGVLCAMDSFHELAATNGEHSPNAFKIALHLESQLDYLNRGNPWQP